MITKDDLKAELEMSDVVAIELDDGYSYDVGIASYWIGGSESGYMSDLLGNVEYRSVDELLAAIFSFLEEDGRTIESVR